jgi:hypothetical protein
MPGLELMRKVQKKPGVYIIVKLRIFNGKLFSSPRSGRGIEGYNSEAIFFDLRQIW